MPNQLTVALFQLSLAWENPVQNRLYFEGFIKKLPPQVDLIVFPELFTSGFTMRPQTIAETMEGSTMAWLKTMASTHQLAICGSLVIGEDDTFYNRLVFVHPDGNVDTYNKKHSFTLAGEHKVYTSGQERLIVDYKGWKICPLICYDLRFPVWSRNTDAYDLLIYVANWPKQRIAAWSCLLQARAIENMSYTIGVNRVGLDANGHEYSGHSAVYDALGKTQTNIEPYQESVTVVTLDKVLQDKQRQKFQFLEDRDAFNLM